MDSKDIRALMESYSAVYQEDTDLELDLDLTGIEDITDQEIDEIVEETIAEMIEEGYDFDEVEEIFEEVILEMNPYAPAGSKAARQYARSTSASKRGAERAAKINKLKSSVKDALGRARQAVTDRVTGARKTVAKKVNAAKSAVTQQAMKAANVKPSDIKGPSGKPRNAGNFDTRYAKTRSQARQAIGNKIKGKVSDAAGRARTLGAGVASAAASAPGAAKSAVKRGLRGAATALSRGARNVARKLGEGVDPYDVVLEHLLDEGYANTEDQAIAIMANMSEQWRDQILEMGENIGPEPKTVGGKERPGVTGETYAERKKRMRPKGN